MLVMSPGVATGGLEVRNDIALGKDRQPLDELRGQLAAAGLNQSGVEFAIADRDLAQLGGCCTVETLKRIEHRPPVFIGRNRRGECRCVGFDLEPKIVDLVELGRRHRPHDVSAVCLTC